MWPMLLNLWHSFSNRAPWKDGSRRSSGRRRPRLEVLEDRTVPASLGWSTYLPGAVYATAVDGAGNIYATGNGWGPGVFVAKLNATGTALDWVTNLGTSGFGTGIAVDASGDVYVGGAGATGLPTTANALATTEPSSANPGFLTVLSPTGSSLLYSTWLPGTIFVGNGATLVNGPAVAIDHSGDATGSPDNVYLTGEALAGLPTTAGAFQPNLVGTRNAFFAEIDPNLSGAASLLYGSYLGGGADAGTGIAVDGPGNAYLTGRTDSTSFPTTTGAFQTTFGGGLEDAFVAKFNPALSGAASLVYSTYVGGSGYDGEYTDYPAVVFPRMPGPGIAVDSAGDAYVTGTTTSTNFPTTPGAFQTTYHNANNSRQQGDAFVTKLNTTGTGLVYSTLLGGSDNDGGTAIAVDASGNASVTGWTRSTDFPTVNPIQAQKAGGADSQAFPNSDVFVATLNGSGSGLLFSTYFGGRGGAINKKGVFTGSNGDEYGYALALDGAGNVYVAGATGVSGEANSTNFPTTAGAFQTTPGGGFAFKIEPLAAVATPVPGGSTGGGSPFTAVGLPPLSPTAAGAASAVGSASPTTTAAVDRLFTGYAGEDATLAALLLDYQGDGPSQGPIGHLRHRP